MAGLRDVKDWISGILPDISYPAGYLARYSVQLVTKSCEICISAVCPKSLSNLLYKNEPRLLGHTVKKIFEIDQNSANFGKCYLKQGNTFCKA